MSETSIPSHEGRDVRNFVLFRDGVSVLSLLVGALVISVLAMTFGYGLSQARLTTLAEELESTEVRLNALSTAHETLQERNWLLFSENTRLQEQFDAAAQPSLATSSTGDDIDSDRTVWSDGVYVVGRDIEPGTYDGRATADIGYWARLKSTSGMVSGIITNNVVRGPFVVIVNPSDTALELRGVTIAVSPDEE